MKSISLYTVARTKYKDGNPRDTGEFQKKRHGSHDGEISLCGKNLTDGWWYIVTNDFFRGSNL